jgi:hypothetical protein
MEGISPPKGMEITVQIDQLLIIRRQCPRVWCEKCGRDVEVVGLVEAGVLARISHPMLLPPAALDAWHIFPGQDGEPRVCRESLKLR